MKSRISRREFLARSAATAALASLSPSAVVRSIEPASTPAAASAALLDPDIVRRFGARLKGRLILPSDASYDAARRIYNGRFDRRPAMIVRCADTEDVVRAVDFARRNTLVVSVRSGGHDYAGYSSCDGGMVIDLTKIRGISVDRERRSAQVGGGLEVGQLYYALEAHGLTTTSGTCFSVGVGGLTLGGGEGPLLCNYGLACDNVLSAQVVTADGGVLTASHQENSDLFWAIRGGGGNFGVVTRFEFRLFAIDRVLRGELTYALSQCRNLLRFYRGFAASAPDALTTGLFFGPSPGEPFTLWFCYTGDLAEGERVVKPLRSFGPPLEVAIKAMRPAEAFVEQAEPPGTCVLQSGAFIPELSDPVIDLICGHLESAPPMFEIGMDELRGAALRGDSAFPLRTPGFDSWVAAKWMRAGNSRAAIAWMSQVWHDLAPLTKGVYVNRLHDEGEERARQAYGANYPRLAAIKGKYDPTNFFRMNQNIRPAT